MGFELQYQYPVEHEYGSVQDILYRLKGVDAAVMRVYKHLKLNVEGEAVGKADRDGREWLLDEIPQMDYAYDQEDRKPSDDLAHGLLIKSYDEETMGDMFQWVTNLMKNALPHRRTVRMGTRSVLVNSHGTAFMTDATIRSPHPASSTLICVLL
jgi:hypothetical protein